MAEKGTLDNVQSKKSRPIYAFLTTAAVFCGLVWSVTNVSFDTTYHISMSQRLLTGDKMFLEMWEPHQTSAFLSAGLMWLYETLFHTTTGIVLYLQVCGILIRGTVAVLFYRTLRTELEKPMAYGMALLFFMISPKDLALPEFSNMQLWYSALLFCCLYAYLRRGNRFLLAAAGFWLCLAVLAYPSCLLLYPGIIGLLACLSENRRADILIFTAVCAGFGAAMGGYFLFTLGPHTLLQCIRGMLALEPSHTVGISRKLFAYLKDAVRVVPVYLTAGLLAFCLSRFLQAASSVTAEESKESAGQKRLQLWLLCSAGIFLAGFFLNILSAENRAAYGLIFLFVIVLGLRNKSALTGERKKLYLCLSVIGGLEFLAALLLSNLPLLSSVPYGLLAATAAMLPIERSFHSHRAKKAGRVCFVCFVMLLAFRCVYVRTPLTGRGQICSVLSDLSMVRVGPAWGIISNEEGVCIERDSYPQWKEWIRPGDKVWIIGDPANTLGYLYEDVEVAGPSTISTPSYSSSLPEYWRLNPDKYPPDVIVAESYLGQPAYELQNNAWLQSWLEEEYRPELIVDGTYWKFYFKKAR